MSLPLTRVVSELHRFAQPLSDAELLERFVSEQDEAAFTVLVERHGPMVLRLCRRVLDMHAADDAVQATFLVLARKAATLRRPAALAGWLYGVAQRIALKACRGHRSLSRCRAYPPALHDPAPDPLSALTARELLLALEEELARLPERYRMAIVVCCLEGHSRDEAATRLGCTTGALRGWLERGRARLHARLLKRGLTLSAAFAAAATVHVSPPPVTAAALIYKSAGVPVEVARLASVALRGSVLAKLPLALLVTLALGAGVLWHMAGGAPSGDAPKPAAPQPVAAGAPAPVDANGDPLPPEAVGRIGSLRLRGGQLGYLDNDKTIVSVAGDSLQFWDADTGKLRRTVRAKLSGPNLFALSPDGKVVHVVGAHDYWTIDVQSGKELCRRPLPKDLEPFRESLSADGQLTVFERSAPLVRLFDLATGEWRNSVKLPGDHCAVAIAAAARLVAISHEGVIRVHDLVTGRCRAEWKTRLKATAGMIMSPDGATLLGWGHWERHKPTDPVVIWDAKTGQERARITGVLLLPLPGLTAFTADGRYVAFSEDSPPDIRLHELASGKEVRRFRAWQSWHMTFSHDNKRLLASNRYGAIGQWEVATGNLLRASADPVLGVAPLRFVDGGKHLLVERDQSTFAVVDWKTGRELRCYAATERNYPVLSPDCSLLAVPATGSDDIDLVDALTGKTVRTLAGHAPFMSPTQFSPDGKKIASCACQGDVRLWDVASGKRLHLMAESPVRATILAFSPDSRKLAAGCLSNFGNQGDAYLLIWDVDTGRIVRRVAAPWRTVAALTFDPTGATLAASGAVPADPADTCEVRLFDMSTGALVKTVAQRYGHVDGLSYSPDGRTLVVAGQHGISVCELATGQERHRFAGDGQNCQCVFSPDGGLLASAALMGGPALIWDVYGTHGNAPRAAAPWSQGEQDRLWQHLAGADAKAAFQAMRRLVRQPDAAVRLLRERLKPAPPADARLLKQWLDGLDSADFETRQDALLALEKLGDRIESALREAYRREQSLEAKRRIAALLAKLDAPTPERLVRCRTLEALEQMATADAMCLLDALASGAPTATLTREATAARDRVQRR